MKSEHRHELAENDLSKLLSKWGAEFDKHANTILTVLIVVTLIAAGVIYWTRTSAATSALGWTDLANASSAEEYQNVAEVYAGTRVAEWATLRAAGGFLEEGIRLSLSDRPASNDRLDQAKTSYEALLNNSGVPKEIREQALLGYAVTLETASDGDTSEAVAAYEKLISEFEKTRFQRFAEDRIADLKTGGAQDFYAWFHQLNPKPADLPMPQDQMLSPGAGDLTNLLPELGGTGVPDFPPLEMPAEGGDGKAEDDLNPFADAEKTGDTAADDGKKPVSADSAPPAPEKPKSPAADDSSAEVKPDAPADESQPDESPESEASKTGDESAIDGDGESP